MNNRRVQRNASLVALISAILLVTSAVVPGNRRTEALSIVTAYASLSLLVATLSIGPLNVIRGVSNPLSTHLRRDLGIWTAITGIAHTVLGLQVHKGGDLMAYFALGNVDAETSRPAVAFVVTNYMGALASVVLLGLLVLSNNASIRFFGAVTWKRMQRSSYAVILLVAAHGLIYQLLEQRNARAVALCLAMFATAGALQLHGFVRRSKH